MSKTALVTGAARRLGKDIAISLAESGFDIVLNYFSSGDSDVSDAVNKIKEFNVNVLPVKADISDVNEIKKMFGEVKKNFDSLDVLVNNAAVFEKTDFTDMDEKVYDRALDLNLKGAAFCSSEASKLMMNNKNKPCHIVNIASLGGFMNWESFVPYSVAKAGVIKLTEITAKRLAPDILVNAIAPGTIVIENDDNVTVDFREVTEYPVRRFGKSSDIVSLLRYLVIENKFITGRTIVADGGRIL